MRRRWQVVVRAYDLNNHYEEVLPRKYWRLKSAQWASTMLNSYARLYQRKPWVYYTVERIPR